MDTVSSLTNQVHNRRILISIIACFILTITLSMLMELSTMLALILSVQIVSFFLVFHRPIWAIGALLVGQLTASQFVFFISGNQTSMRFIWTIFAFFLLISILGKEKKISLGYGAGRVIVPGVILFFLAIVANIVNTDMTYVLELVRSVATWVLILIMLPAVVKDEQDIKILAMVAFFSCLVSAGFALMQHYSFRFLPVVNTIFPGDFNGRRVIGLNESPVDLSFTLPLVILPVICVLLHNAIKPRFRILIILSIVLMTAALYFTFTRSGIYSLGIGMIAMGLFIRIKGKKEILLALAVVCVAFVVYTDIKGNRYSKGINEESSAAGRLLLVQAGTKIAMDYPLLGIGNRGFKEMSQAYIPSISYDPSVVDIHGVIGIEQPHNDFIRVWISFGTPALLAYLWLFVTIFLNFLEAYRRSHNRFIRGMAIGCFAALVAYAVSAATHNVMDSVVLLWVLGGISIALCKLVAKERLNLEKVTA